MKTFNIQDYLDSGILEMYVLDQLNDAERAEVEQLAAQHPEILQEIVEIEEALGTYHTLNGLTPPAQTLGKILEATATSAPAMATHTASSTGVSPLSYWLAAAALIGLIASVGLYFSQQAALNKAEALQRELWTTRSKEQDCAENERFLQQQLQILQQDGLRKVTVKAGTAPIAAVYWNKDNQTAYLGALNLSDPGQDKQYQLWAFVAGQTQPVSVGVVDWQDLKRGLVSFQFKQQPALFAISLEKTGGAPQPTDVKGASEAVI